MSGYIYITCPKCGQITGQGFEGDMRWTPCACGHSNAMYAEIDRLRTENERLRSENAVLRSQVKPPNPQCYYSGGVEKEGESR